MRPRAQLARASCGMIQILVCGLKVPLQPAAAKALPWTRSCWLLTNQASISVASCSGVRLQYFWRRTPVAVDWWRRRVRTQSPCWRWWNLKCDLPSRLKRSSKWPGRGRWPSNRVCCGMGERRGRVAGLLSKGIGCCRATLPDSCLRPPSTPWALSTSSGCTKAAGSSLGPGPWADEARGHGEGESRSGLLLRRRCSWHSTVKVGRCVGAGAGRTGSRGGDSGSVTGGSVLEAGVVESSESQSVQASWSSSDCS
jgi:hypothetical protein